ncbi:MAG TPA: polysaccharide biosynthesis C-terminal domain-containing protein [Actinoplanes sp.]|nr:polysaccharide biosynthesis C-terminal domain-containing protein [Actinoplanes sp.]
MRGLLVGHLAIIGGSFFANLVAARTMGPAGRGELAVFLQVSYILSAVAMVGIDRAYLVAHSESPSVRAAAREIYGLVRIAVGVILAGCLLTSIALTPWVRSAWLYGAALTVLVLGNGLIASTRTVAVATNSARLYRRATVVAQIVLIGLVGVFATAGAGSPVIWLFGYGVAQCLPPLVGLFLRREPAGDGPAQALDSTSIRRLGWRLLAGTLANMAMLRSDRLLLPWLASYQQVGIYVVAATFSEFMVLPVQSAVDACVPRWRAAFQAGSLRAGKIILIALGYALAATVVLASLGDFLVMAFGSAYAESVRLLLPLSGAAGLWCVNRVAVGLLVAMGRARGVLCSDVPAMVLTVGGCLVLIPSHGALGAALASAAGYGAAAAVAVALCRRDASKRLVGGGL